MNFLLIGNRQSKKGRRVSQDHIVSHPTEARIIAALFAGASHALLASVVFAFETTRQTFGLLQLLAGSTAAYLVSLLCNRRSIMTEKLARRGTRVRPDYAADYLAYVLVQDVASLEVVTLREDETLDAVRS